MRLIDAEALHDRFYELTKFKRDEQTNDYVAQRYVKISDALRMINEAQTVYLVPKDKVGQLMADAAEEFAKEIERRLLYGDNYNE